MRSIPESAAAHAAPALPSRRKAGMETREGAPKDPPKRAFTRAGAHLTVHPQLQPYPFSQPSLVVWDAPRPWVSRHGFVGRDEIEWTASDALCRPEGLAQAPRPPRPRHSFLELASTKHPFRNTRAPSIDEFERAHFRERGRRGKCERWIVRRIVPPTCIRAFGAMRSKC